MPMPYFQAGIASDGQPTATCPTCGEVIRLGRKDHESGSMLNAQEHYASHPLARMVCFHRFGGGSVCLHCGHRDPQQRRGN